jgi:molybdopterin-guanine dinucleotide biosynthesis protein A
MMTESARERLSGQAALAAIFAGGAGRRMGGADKGRIVLGGKPLFQIVAERLSPQAEKLAVLAPDEPSWLEEIPAALSIRDAAGEEGPGAGLLGALRFLGKEYGPDALLLTAPVDAPFLPADLFAKLEAARRRTEAPAAIVRHAGGLHPVFGVWRASCAGVVARAMEEERALHRIALKAGAVECEAWAGAAPDPFTNLNTPEDVASAETFLREL